MGAAQGQTLAIMSCNHIAGTFPQIDCSLRAGPGMNALFKRSLSDSGSHAADMLTVSVSLRHLDWHITMQASSNFRDSEIC